MSKKRKKKIHMIDMSARLNIEVLPASTEEMEALQHELDEIEKSVNKRMMLYEEQLKCLITESINESKSTMFEQDPLYFIEKYEKLIKNRNENNIENRLKQYQIYFSEQDD